METPAADTNRDALIATLITAASDAIMDETEREFAPAGASATRRFRVWPARIVDGSYYVDLTPPVSDLRAASLVKLHPEETSPTTLTADDDYILDPVGAPQGTYTAIRLSSWLGLNSTILQKFGFAYLDVTATWGFATVPTNVVQACVLTVTSWLRRDISQFGFPGDAGADEQQPIRPPSYSI